MDLSSWLLDISGPVVRRVMVSLGLAVVTYSGLDLAVGWLLEQAMAAWAGSLSADVAAYLAMSGVNTGLSLIAGAITGRLALFATKGLQFV